MLASLGRWIARQSTASPARSAVVRYGGTIVAAVLVAVLYPYKPLGPATLVAAFSVLVACSWLGGLGPALLGPLVMGVAYRWATLGAGSAVDLSFKGLMVTLAF